MGTQAKLLVLLMYYGECMSFINSLSPARPEEK